MSNIKKNKSDTDCVSIYIAVHHLYEKGIPHQMQIADACHAIPNMYQFKNN